MQDMINLYAGAGVSRHTDPPLEYAKFTNAVQKAAEATRLGIPFAISSDPRNHEGGSQYGVSLIQEDVTLWPQPIGFGAISVNEESEGLEIIESAANVIREEYRAMGIQIALHPQVDLFTEPRWGRISGNFATEDAELTGKMGAAYIRGLQGDSLDSTSVSAMAKHFAGGGPQKDGIDAHLEEGKNQIYPGNNFEYHVIPFRHAVDQGVAAIMPYYGVPVDQTSENVGMAFNSEIITDKLKYELGFDGIVCTDWSITSDSQSKGGFLGMPWGVEDLTQAERVAKALEAGVDQFGGLDESTPIIDAVNQGLVEATRLDTSIKKLIINKIKLGLFENPYSDPQAVMDIVGQLQEMADEAQIKSTLLLQNKNNALPLESAKTETKVFIYGKTASEVNSLGVIGTENVSEADVAIIRVIAPYSIVPDGTVSLANGMIFNMHGGPLCYGPYEGSSEDLSKYFIYSDGVQVTEPSKYKAANYFDFEHIKEVIMSKGCNTRVIVDVFMERPAILSEFKDEVDAIFASFGISDSNLLKLVFGESFPTAKLPFALPSSMEVVEIQEEDVPSFDETHIYGEDNPFPYGFGLTY
jgi:beta-glucosidase